MDSLRFPVATAAASTSIPEFERTGFMAFTKELLNALPTQSYIYLLYKFVGSGTVLS